MSVKASEGPESRGLFVNREALIADFLRRIHSTPKNDVLFLYGEGGIGKSSLLDQFEDHYARRIETPEGRFLDPWVNLSASAPRELVHQFSNFQSRPLTCARINFWERALGKDPRDAFFGLQAIRKRLKVPAPLFQSACVLYVHGTEGLTREWMAELFPGDRADFAVGLVDQPWTSAALAGLLHLVAHGAAVTIPAVGIAALVRGLWGLSATLEGPALAARAAKRKLGNAIQDLASYKPGELLEELPRLLAEDTNAALDDETDRIILLFDAYDRFTGSEHHLSSGDRYAPDKWFRGFLKHLHLDEGAVVVVTGQELPAWDEEVPIDARAVDYLANADASVFLEKAGIDSDARREGLIHYASVAPDQVQPLFLALLVDAHRLANERGAPPDAEHLPEDATVQHQQKAIIDRLLTAADADLRNAIAALAACRSFDWNAFHWLGQKLAFASFRSEFDTLTGLSCVRQSGESAFVMHSLIRRFLGGEKAGHQIHEACREYYSCTGDSIADAVYHEYFLNKEAAARSWIDAFRGAARRSEHEECGSLLAVRKELPGSFAIEFDSEAGEYLARMSRYDDAERELSIAAHYWGEKSSRDGDRDIAALNSRGDALQRWATLRAQRSDHQGAEEKYGAAVEAYDRAQVLAPNDIGALNNKGLALQNWADLRAQRSDRAGAEEKYSAAVGAYDQALAVAPNDIAALSNKGGSLQRWADLRVEQSDYPNAEEKYRAAVEAYDQALTMAPNYIDALNNKGLALQNWADLRAQWNGHPRAEEMYGAAVEAYDRALALASLDPQVLNNKGIALGSWAGLRAQRSDPVGAEEKYGAAVGAYDQALAVAPDDIAALNNKGNALQSWADLRGDHADTDAKYGAAVEAYDRALALAPNDIDARNNKGNALAKWANLRAQLSDPVGAEEKYGAAVGAYDQVLAVTPDDIAALHNKGGALQSWADLRAQRSDRAGAEEKYSAAVEAYDRAVALAPNYINALTNKGIALRRWALMKLADEEAEIGMDLLRRSSQSCASALRISANPASYRILAVNLLATCHVAEGETACEKLCQATQLCLDWETGFPWDTPQIAPIRRLIEAEKQRLDCQ
jgi:tetratricopeptide (TPR) repeat protein